MSSGRPFEICLDRLPCFMLSVSLVFLSSTYHNYRNGLKLATSGSLFPCFMELCSFFLYRSSSPFDFPIPGGNLMTCPVSLSIPRKVLPFLPYLSLSGRKTAPSSISISFHHLITTLTDRSSFPAFILLVG